MYELILTKLKYVYNKNNNIDLIKNFIKNVKHATNNTLINSPSDNELNETEDKEAEDTEAKETEDKEAEDTEAKETEDKEAEDTEANETELNCLFKKINILFTILADLLKYNIAKIDDDRYRNVSDEKIKFPKTIDALVLIIGCYGNAFSSDDQEELFNILELSSYNDLYTISEIPIDMIPFVANNKIDIESLNTDYINFSEKVLNFSCRVLNINTELEQDFIVENTIENSD
jgi:hypothetical protein